MTPDEVRLLDNSKCILFIRGERPVVDYKYNLLKHPNIRCTEDGGAAPYDYTAADNARDDLPGAPDNYELLDMDDFLPAEAAEMKPTIRAVTALLRKLWGCELRARLFCGIIEPRKELRLCLKLFRFVI